MNFKRVFLLFTAVATFTFSARADSGTLQVSGTPTITFSDRGGGQSRETISMSYDLQNGVLIPGSAQLTASGPVSFAGASVLVGGDQCGVGFIDALGDIVETDFYEDENCLATGQPKAGDVGLFYMLCVVCGADNFGNGFAYVTELQTNVPEPSTLLLLMAGICGTIARARKTGALQCRGRSVLFPSRRVETDRVLDHRI